MLIKIESRDEVDLRDISVLLHADDIREVVSYGDGYRATVVTVRGEYSVTSNECKRITALLTAPHDPAPAAAVQNPIKTTPLFNQAWWDKFDYLVEDWQKGGTVYQAHTTFAALEAHVMTFPHALPADVIDAYRGLNAMMDKPWDTSDLIVLIFELKDAIARHIPTEESESHD